MLQTLVRATGCHCVRRHSLSPGITAVPVNVILLKGIMSQYIGKPLDIIKREYEAQREVGISDGAAGEDGREVPGSSSRVPKVCGISDEQLNELYGDMVCVVGEIDDTDNTKDYGERSEGKKRQGKAARK